MVADDDPTPDKQDESIVPDPTDAIEFEPIERTSPKRGGLLWLMAVLLVGGGAGAWYFKGDLLKGVDNNEIPVIRAVEGPVKVRPENPGGMLIPDRDKLVYDRLKGESADTTVERLLPPPEAPLPVPESEETQGMTADSMTTSPESLVPESASTEASSLNEQIAAIPEPPAPPE